VQGLVASILTGFILFDGIVLLTHVFPLAWLMLLMGVLFDGLLIYRGNEYFFWIHLLEGWWGEPIGIFLSWFLITASRICIMRCARKDIQQDIDRYTVEWEVLSNIQHTWHVLSDIEWSANPHHHPHSSSSLTMRSLESLDSALEAERQRQPAHAVAGEDQCTCGGGKGLLCSS